MLRLAVCLLLLASVFCSSIVRVPHGDFKRLPDGSLSFTVEDYPDTNSIDLHFNVNDPLSGVAAGKYNPHITKASDGSWTYTNSKISLKPGDKIYYWILFNTIHGGYQETDLSQTIPSDTTTKKTTPTPTTTPKITPTTSTPGGNYTTTTGPSTVSTATPKPSPTTKAPPSPDQCTSYPCVIFEDEFDTLDFKKWKHEITAGGGGNWEFEVYVNNRSNSWVNNSKLHIRPTLTSELFGEAYLSSGLMDIWGTTEASQCTSGQFYGCFRQGTGTNYLNPIQSAKLRTTNSFNFRYGRVEVEAKMPKGDWLWPAIWLLPKDEHYGIWPASGEIDIVESRGNANYKDHTGKGFGNNWMASTMHWGPHYGANAYLKTHVEKVAQDGDFSSSVHKYAVEWDDQQLVFYLDGEETMTVKPDEGGFWKLGEFDKDIPGTFNPWASDGGHMAPFDREFYLIINLAVGGTNGFFPQDAQNSGYPKPWNDKSQTAVRDFWMAKDRWLPTWKYPDDSLQVNYIRVSKLKPDPK